MDIEARQEADFEKLLAYACDFWRSRARDRSTGGVTPSSSRTWEDEIRRESLPQEAQTFEAISEAIDRLVAPNVLKNTHPLFLGYVTPPSTDIGALGALISAVLNQNVMFSKTSPIGTAIEQKVIDWLAAIVGLGPSAGGIITNGGSMANLYGLAVARRSVLGASINEIGNRAAPGALRIYCSSYTHHSVDKAAILMGMGKNGVKRIACDKNHRILTSQLREVVAVDSKNKNCRPVALVGNAGTRHNCAFDDIDALREIADEFGLWLHVDAAYGGFLRLADNPPPGLAALPKADSITINPHKLLFVPFEAGAFLVRNAQYLRNTFGTEGEYRSVEEPASDDFADLGMQLGRGMEALKVWLTLKYFGTRLLGKEYTRLMNLAIYLRNIVEEDPRLELLAPVAGTAVCFRWVATSSAPEDYTHGINAQIPALLRQDGLAFIDEVTLDGKRGFRVCLTNFRTKELHLDIVVKRILSLGEELLRGLIDGTR